MSSRVRAGKVECQPYVKMRIVHSPDFLILKCSARTLISSSYCQLICQWNLLHGCWV